MCGSGRRPTVGDGSHFGARPTWLRHARTVGTFPLFVPNVDRLRLSRLRGNHCLGVRNAGANAGSVCRQRRWNFAGTRGANCCLLVAGSCSKRTVADCSANVTDGAHHRHGHDGRTPGGLVPANAVVICDFGSGNAQHCVRFDSKTTAYQKLDAKTFLK